MAGTSDTNNKSGNGVRVQASVSHQMQQWLSESDKEAPWTPLGLTNPSAGHVAANTVTGGNPEILLDNSTIQTHNGGNNA
ncbi:hypothetical protein TRIATDRAFT_318023 [Trichoderma atroviride IMI 206040]|uniref:Uncharacterized protein n=1 Tax=Hypocrea atroviridis (strain ATCC 20476 / IMI 206040) TaxID=452589 RepID=G9NT50_HYPAI|nr:uncharacterized protein TRIATDRAFT_318023 [Trichoderma atroviride IMI 206040]EHK45898.1 hypothetical protein TRIATDRAFT_318023 [Trichoderma atroviride IMI 206040]